MPHKIFSKYFIVAAIQLLLLICTNIWRVCSWSECMGYQRLGSALTASKIGKRKTGTTTADPDREVIVEFHRLRSVCYFSLTLSLTWLTVNYITTLRCLLGIRSNIHFRRDIVSKRTVRKQRCNRIAKTIKCSGIDVECVQIWWIYEIQCNCNHSRMVTI